VSSNFLKKENNQKFNLGTDSLHDILNSQHLKQVRQSMLQGELVKGCERCYHDEKFGGKSNRIWHTVHFLKNPSIKNKLDHAISNDNLISTVEYFDIRFGNLCNLACRSCYTGASSQLNREVIKLYDTTEISRFQAINHSEDNSWHQTDVFRNNIVTQFNHIDSYYMNGGEPTIIDSNIKILQDMIVNKVSDNITISLNSNMTNTKKEFYDLLPHFKTVRFMASIDGIGQMQEYLRYPSDWHQIDANFRKLISLGHQNIKIQVTPVISKINLQFITDLFKHLDDLKSQYQASFEVNPIILHQPEILDVQFLPLEYKTQCWYKIQMYLSSAQTKFGVHFLNAMKILENKCTISTDYMDNLKSFFQYNDILDSSRHQKLSDVNPELNSFRTL
jgi:sulfatase maturation enzyme AslB (radical SAM superfamily)